MEDLGPGAVEGALTVVDEQGVAAVPARDEEVEIAVAVVIAEGGAERVVL